MVWREGFGPPKNFGVASLTPDRQLVGGNRAADGLRPALIPVV